MDTTNIKLHKLLNDCRCSISPDLDVASIAALIDMREDYALNHQASMANALKKGTSPNADDLAAARYLRDQAALVEAQFSGEMKSPNMMQLFNLISSLHEELDNILNAYYLAGLSAKGQFDNRGDFSWYTVPADYTIYEVALRFYGSRDAINKILEANPTLGKDSIALKTIKLPGVMLGEVDPSIYYGVDADDDIMLEDDDIKLLSPLDSVVQALTNTCKHGSAETPEFPDFGNPYISAIGSSGLNRVAATSKLLDSIYLDPAVDTASIRELDVVEDAVVATVNVKLVGSNKTISIKS